MAAQVGVVKNEKFSYISSNNLNISWQIIIEIYIMFHTCIFIVIIWHYLALFDKYLIAILLLNLIWLSWTTSLSRYRKPYRYHTYTSNLCDIIPPRAYFTKRDYRNQHWIWCIENLSYPCEIMECNRQWQIISFPNTWRKILSSVAETKWPPPCWRHIQRHFLFNDNVYSSIQILLKCVPEGQINNIPALVQVMVWCRPDDKPLSELLITDA